MPEYLMKELRNYNSLMPNDKSMDDEILAASKIELLDSLLDYNGIEGCTHTIISWIEAIWNIKLE